MRYNGSVVYEEIIRTVKMYCPSEVGLDESMCDELSCSECWSRAIVIRIDEVEKDKYNLVDNKSLHDKAFSWED